MSDSLPPVTGDPMVDSILQGGGLGGGATGNEPIGGSWSGPTGLRDPNTGAVPDMAMAALPVNHPGRTEGIAAPYTADYVQSMWSALPLEDKVRLQDRLVSYGLTSEVLPGELDDGTLRGLETLLAMSNRSGTTWQATMGRLSDLDAQGLLETAQREPEWEPEPYLAPDYARMAQTVKQMFAERLGREPDQYEMAQFQAELSGFDRLAHERQQELRQIQFEQAQQPGQQGGATVQGVDPIARFQQRFDELYANELDFIEAKEDAQRSREVVDSAVNLASQMSREVGR